MRRIKVLETAAKPLAQEIQNLGPCSTETSVVGSQFNVEDGAAIFGNINVAPESCDQRWHGGGARSIGQRERTREGIRESFSKGDHPILTDLQKKYKMLGTVKVYSEQLRNCIYCSRSLHN